MLPSSAPAALQLMYHITPTRRPLLVAEPHDPKQAMASSSSSFSSHRSSHRPCQSRWRSTWQRRRRRRKRRPDLVAALERESTRELHAPRRPRAATLLNLCVDVFHERSDGTIAQLRRDFNSVEERIDAIHASSAGRAGRSSDDESVSTPTLELGGNANFAVAAARLGMDVQTIGVVGKDKLGAWFTNELTKEDGITVVDIVGDESSGAQFHTLECNVIVEKPSGQHGFFSMYDTGNPFGKAVAAGIGGKLEQASDAAFIAVSEVDVLFINGFTFDEAQGDLVVQLACAAREGGAMVLFDAGPRVRRLSADKTSAAFHTLLRQFASVVLATEEEAKVLLNECTDAPMSSGNDTSTSDAIEDAKYASMRLLDVCENASYAVVKIGRNGIVIACREGQVEPLHVDGFDVEVGDTVGCGDSLAAAFAMGIVQGASISTVGALSNATGAATASRHGAGRNVAAAPTVRSIILSAAHGRPGCPEALTLLDSLRRDPQ